MPKTKMKKLIYRLVWINWEIFLGLNLLVHIGLLFCPWKLKVAASAQGCLMLLLLLLLQCSCYARAQLIPKPTQPLPNDNATLQWLKIFCPTLVGCLSKNKAKETPHSLRITIWAKSALCSYPGLAIRAKS